MTTTLTFPTLRGRSWSTTKKPVFATRISLQQSGHEVRSAQYPFPRWEFNLTYSYLPDSGDLQALMGLYAQCQGGFANFLFRDVTDYAVRGGFIATTDGATVQWPFGRKIIDAAPVEPIGQVDLSTVATFGPGDVHMGANTIDLTMPPTYATGQMTDLPPNTEDGPFFVSASAGGALPGGVTALTPYWVRNLGGNTVQLAVSLSQLRTGHIIPFSSVGSGTFALTKGYALYLDGSLVSPSAFSLSGANQIVFGTAPTTGQTLTADFDFWFVCRFLDDSQDYENFMDKLWKLAKCDFVAPPA